MDETKRYQQTSNFVFLTTFSNDILGVLTVSNCLCFPAREAPNALRQNAPTVVTRIQTYVGDCPPPFTLWFVPCSSIAKVLWTFLPSSTRVKSLRLKLFAFGFLLFLLLRKKWKTNHGECLAPSFAKYIMFYTSPSANLTQPVPIPNVWRDIPDGTRARCVCSGKLAYCSVFDCKAADMKSKRVDKNDVCWYFLSASLSAVITVNKHSELGVGSVFRPCVHRVDICHAHIFAEKIHRWCRE